MNNLEQTIEWSLCRCVNTKIGTIAIKGGMKYVFIVELVTDTGEILIKFFNVSTTTKGNFTVDRNSDLAKQYRLVTGKNPVKKYSQCDQLLKHFVGYLFEAQCTQALDKRGNEYLKVIALKPKNPIVNDGWTITGHLIKNVRQVRGESGKNWGCFREKSGKNWGKTRDSDLTLARVKPSPTDDFNPIQHPLSKIGTSHIYLNNYIDINNRDSNSKNQPPDIQGLKSIIKPENIFLH